MKMLGYMIVKIRKTVNICLFADNKDDIEEMLSDLKATGTNTNGMQIVPLYEKDNKRYIQTGDKLLRIA